MAFWTNPKYEPIKTFQFRLYIGDAENEWFWAKQVTLPSFEVNETQYQLVNHKFKYPGMVTWNDVNITVVETGTAASAILSLLKRAGYTCPGACGQGLSKSAFYSGKTFRIEQLYDDGATRQAWDLSNWFIKGARFGEMNYENDDFVNVEMIIGYDCATLSAGARMSEADKKKLAKQGAIELKTRQQAAQARQQAEAERRATIRKQVEQELAAERAAEAINQNPGALDLPTYPNLA